MVYKTCLSQFDSHMHEAQVRGICWGRLFTLYSYHTLWNSLQAVYKWLCSLRISLNSGFDTGNDSWFSSGAWQVGTPVQKMPAGTGALLVGEPRTSRSCLLPLLGLALCGKKNKIFALFEKDEENARTFTRAGATEFLQGMLSHMHTFTYSAKICMGGWSRSAQAWWCRNTANSKVPTQTALIKLLASRKREDTQYILIALFSRKHL